MFLRILLLPALALLAVCGGPAPAPGPPDPSAGACCRELEALLEATVFRFDVARLRLTVDAQTAVDVEALATRPARGGLRPEAIAERYLAAETVEAEMTLLLSMSGEQFLENTGETLLAMVPAGQISTGEAAELVALSRDRFDFLLSRGVRAGDRIVHHLEADTVVTSFLGSEGELFADRQVGPMHRRAVLGSWFAPGSEFRDALLDLVLRRAG